MVYVKDFKDCMGLLTTPLVRLPVAIAIIALLMGILLLVKIEDPIEYNFEDQKKSWARRG